MMIATVSNRRGLIFFLAAALVLATAILAPKSITPSAPHQNVASNATVSDPALAANSSSAARTRRSASSFSSPEEIVAKRLAKFSAHQRAIVRKLADHYHLTVPPDVGRFFDALDVGNWDEAQRIFKLLRHGYNDASVPDDSLRPFWRPILEAYGAAEQAHLWPAQEFLDYGNNILNSLQPGMVYVGGTDSGCFIPTMLNGSSDGDQHITLTQNALADNSYLDYLRVLNDGSLNIPTAADSEAAFNQYVQDAKQRLEHDQQFPNEPPQLLPGENVTEVNGSVNVSGQVSVMQINNILMQDLIKANPGVSFALEQSFPLASTFPGAAPLGPIFQLNASPDGQNAITPDAANQVVNYWQDEVGNLQADLSAATSDAAVRSYSHDAASQGDLLANNNYPDQAAQAYLAALDISPNCLDAIKGLTQVLAQQGQYEQAGAALDNYLARNPSQSQAIASIRQTYLRAH